MSTSETIDDAPSLSPEARAFLDAPRFAVIATLDPDGWPHQAVVWPANLRRDPRIHFSVEDGYRYVQGRGSVRVEDAQPIAQADIAEMARRYHADEPDEAEDLIRDRFQRQQRVTFRFRLDRVMVDL